MGFWDCRWGASDHAPEARVTLSETTESIVSQSTHRASRDARFRPMSYAHNGLLVYRQKCTKLSNVHLHGQSDPRRWGITTSAKKTQYHTHEDLNSILLRVGSACSMPYQYHGLGQYDSFQRKKSMLLEGKRVLVCMHGTVLVALLIRVPDMMYCSPRPANTSRCL